jgi:hypothetical protein
VALQTSKRYSISCHTQPRTLTLPEAEAVSSVQCCEYEHCWWFTSHATGKEIQRCQVRRAWGPLRPSITPSPVQCKCLIKKYPNSAGVVRRRNCVPSLHPLHYFQFHLFHVFRLTTLPTPRSLHGDDSQNVSGRWCERTWRYLIVYSCEIPSQYLLQRRNKTITTSIRIISLWAENRYRPIGLLCLVPAVKECTAMRQIVRRVHGGTYWVYIKIFSTT